MHLLATEGGYQPFLLGGTDKSLLYMSLAIAIVALALLPFFGLDFIEMRRLVPIDRKGTFDMATMKTGLFGGLFVLALAYLGWIGMQASTKEKTTERKEGQGLIVGQG